MLDFADPRIVGVQVDEAGKVWVCVDGVCQLRVIGAQYIQVDLPGQSFRFGDDARSIAGDETEEIDGN